MTRKPLSDDASATRTRVRRVDVTALLWGLVFVMTGGLASAHTLGARIDWRIVQLATPGVLIALGVLGLVLNRQEKKR